MTLTTRNAEVDRALNENFEIHHCVNSRHPEEEFDLDSGVAMCFEFDYPDRPGLDLMRSTKARYPHIPILMVTTQHSEQLAVWAYRNRVLDYLVKPVSADDVKRCLKLLTALQNGENRRQDKRVIVDFQSRIPAEIPVGQRRGGIRLAPAVHYVEKNFRGKIRNTDVAELCDMSPYHFSHAFAETFSLTFQEFILRYRVSAACKELRHPNVPIGNVAYSVGFNDASYFARVFRRYVGCSPSEFCDRIKRGGSDKRKMDTVEESLLPELESMKVERRQKERWPVSVDRLDG